MDCPRGVKDAAGPALAAFDALERSPKMNHTLADCITVHVELA